MSPQSGRDIIAGAALSVFGFLFALYAATQLSLGDFSRMGSGMFPFLMGTAVAFTGLALLVLTFMRSHRQTGSGGESHVEAPEWRSLAVVVAAIAAFGLLIKLLGAVPAVFALVLVSSLASDKLTARTALVLAVMLSLVAWLVFIVALGLPIRTISWPF